MKALLAITSMLTLAASKPGVGPGAVQAFLKAPSLCEHTSLLPPQLTYTARRSTPLPREPCLPEPFRGSCRTLRCAARANTVALGMGTELGDNRSDGGLAGYRLQLAKTGAVMGVIAAVLAGEVGLVTPAMGELARANAAMAPSLMQDEKGYISIFEKVCTCFCLGVLYWLFLFVHTMWN